MDIKKELKKYIELNFEKDEPIKARSFVVDKIVKKIDVFYEAETYTDELSPNLDEYLKQEKEESKFQKLLFKYIDSRNLKDSDVYNKVNIDRRLFSKIRNEENYHPSKETVILLSLSLELNEDEMLSLLNSASYSLPKNNIYDLIIRFCFINKIYDLTKVNDLLYEYNCKTLN
ncbi:MAG: hypothetical protein IJN90_01670 [Bacilli bacterium]|nr:hypothetical protein [Bacilli bacterium]